MNITIASKYLLILAIVVVGVFGVLNGVQATYYPPEDTCAPDIACSTNAQCGTSTFIGEPVCQGNSVYKNYITHKCNNPGTEASFCSDSTKAIKYYDCTVSQTCGGGYCIEQNNLSVSCSASPTSVNVGQQVTFYSNVSGGSGGYSYLWSGVCSSSSSSCNATINNTGTQTETLTVTSGSQTKTASCYANSNQQCTNRASLKCVGNALYWYDSCGNQQELSQTCQGGCSNNTCQASQGYLTITKQVRNLTSGTSWSSSTFANPNDVVMFLITIQTSGNQNIQNVNIRDFLPANLIYNDQLIVSGGSNNNNNYTGNLTSGIYLNTINAGQSATVSYQARVAPAQNFSFGTSTLTNQATVNSSSSNSQSAYASVIVNRSQVLGASSISTGLTNNVWLDSFILPLLLAILGIGLYKTGAFISIEKWLGSKNKNFNLFKSEKNLEKKISKIKKSEQGII